MSRILIFTNPAHDRTTEYIAAWCDQAVELAKKQPGATVIELADTAATKENFEKAVAEHNPEIVFVNGHGDNDRVYGYKDGVLIRVGENVDILKGRTVHALACSAGELLGPEIIKVGGQSFIGYKKNFEFYHQGKTTRPEQLQDGIAAFFLEPAFKAVESIILGDSAEVAFKKSQDLYREKLLQLMASSNPDYNTTIAARLFHDLTGQILLGGSQPALV